MNEEQLRAVFAALGAPPGILPEGPWPPSDVLYAHGMLSMVMEHRISAATECVPFDEEDALQFMAAGAASALANDAARFTNTRLADCLARLSAESMTLLRPDIPGVPAVVAALHLAALSNVTASAACTGERMDDETRKALLDGIDEALEDVRSAVVRLRTDVRMQPWGQSVPD